VASALLVAVGLAAAIRSRRGRPTTGGEALVGAGGDVVAWHGDTGQVRVNGELWNARAPTAFTPGEKVRVAARHGLVLEVERE
ncbi:MAG: NfeD family protein, partial [Pseudomonadota bacterium]